MLWQIRYWKTGQRNTTETIVEVPRYPPRDTRIEKRAVKETATVNSLPPYSDLEADVVAANTFYTSNSSNVINFTTPEGGKILIHSAIFTFCLHIVNPLCWFKIHLKEKFVFL